jgi:hypothetical protein
MRVKETCLLAHRGFIWISLLSLFCPGLAEAWNGKTHIAIAYLAYKKLNHHAKDRVDEILVLHPLYSEWTRGAKLGQAGLLAFMHAATWPDCIQTPTCPGYTEDGTDGGMTPTIEQEAWQNIGFSDMRMHKYWHLIQIPYAAPGAETRQPPKPNVETQLQMLTEALNSNAEDTLKMYDLAWVENVVGEVHQPLNCVSRFSAEHPKGDRNGRDVQVREGDRTETLHDYWDNLLGPEEDLEAAIKEGKTLAGIQDQNGWWESTDVDKWISESVELAKKDVYTAAVTEEEGGRGAVILDAAYRKAAFQAARMQAALAGNRLALLLNKNLR